MKTIFILCTVLYLVSLTSCSTTAEQSAGSVANNAQGMLGAVWDTNDDDE